MRLATRSSPLALWQAEHVARLLGGETELVLVETLGDLRRDVPVEDLGGTGAFVAEVRNAVLDGRADIAVHSAKDLPTPEVDGLCIACVPERGDPRDALVGLELDRIHAGGRIGTGSARRRVQIAALRPDLVFGPLRGNIETRISKVGADFDAVVVAAAALDRLGLADRVAEIFDVTTFVPQPAQGALAVECRADDEVALAALRAIEHAPSRVAVDCERAFLAEVGGGCGAPLGAYARVEADGSIVALGVLADDAGTLFRHECRGSDAVQVGRALAVGLRSLAGTGSTA